MIEIEYLRQYNKDRGDKYSRLPSFAVAQKIFKVMPQHFTPENLSQATIEALADKFDITDASMMKLIKFMDERN